MTNPSVSGKDTRWVLSAIDQQADRMLRLTVIDPACGSGHFLLAAARRMVTRACKEVFCGRCKQLLLNQTA